MDTTVKKMNKQGVRDLNHYGPKVKEAVAVAVDVETTPVEEPAIAATVVSTEPAPTTA